MAREKTAKEGYYREGKQRGEMCGELFFILLSFW